MVYILTAKSCQMLSCSPKARDENHTSQLELQSDTSGGMLLCSQGLKKEV